MYYICPLNILVRLSTESNSNSLLLLESVNGKNDGRIGMLLKSVVRLMEMHSSVLNGACAGIIRIIITTTKFLLYIKNQILLEKEE